MSVVSGVVGATSAKSSANTQARLSEEICTRTEIDSQTVPPYPTLKE